MPVYEIDPLQDPRWGELLQRDDSATIFHTLGWLQALRSSYGYEPIVLSTTPPGKELRNGVLFCRVNSVLTGRRLVSLPFSDHCEPLVTDEDAFDEIANFLVNERKKTGLKYVEIRPLQPLTRVPCGFSRFQTFYFHTIDLRPDVSELFLNLHKNSFQRKIQRARREGITCENGTSHSFLTQFYRLFVMTRRRHGLPPPPLHWLQNLIRNLGDAVDIRIATKNSIPVAGMLTLKYKDTLIYKYGGSDMRFNNLGGMSLLFWLAMLDGKADGLNEFDLGRCDFDNNGLVTYKDRLGSERSTLTYWRSAVTVRQVTADSLGLKIAKYACSAAPDALRIAVGKLLYRHAG